MKEKNNEILIFTVLGLVAFIAILWAVLSAGGNPLSMDLDIQSQVFSWRTDPLTLPLKLITYMSNPAFIIALIALLLIYKPTRVKVGLPVGISEAAAYAIYQTIKNLVGRARPDAILHLVEQGGFSFPSGHSVTSMVVYGLAIYLIRRYCKNEKLKNILTVVFGLLIVLIGFSRIYVGVHWPTDVLAGWSLGISILSLSIFIQEKRRHKGEQ